MTSKENLDTVTEIYTNDPFERENEIHSANYAAKCVSFAKDRSSWLELGLGHGIALQRLSGAFTKVEVLDGSPVLVERYQGLYPNVEIKLTYFEDYRADRPFMNVGMGFILEHVDDPALILNLYRRFLQPGGLIYVAVPCASSLHRILAVEAGLLSDLRLMSETDARFGHKRYYTYDQWISLFESLDLRILASEGLYLKPFSTAQLASLGLAPDVYRALGKVAASLPQISNACFFVLADA